MLRSRRDAAPLDLSSVAEADKTSENRGAVGVKHDRSASLTSNAVSGTIGDLTPPPLIDPMPGPMPGPVPGPVPGPTSGLMSGPTSGPPPVPGPAAVIAGPPGAAIGGAHRAAIRPSGTGPAPLARGTPKASRISDKVPLRAEATPEGARGVPAPVPVQRSRPVRRDDRNSDSDHEEVTAARGSSTGNPWLTVPVGEFDHGEAIHEQDKLRAAYSQATSKRSVADALLGEPAPAARSTPAEPPRGSARDLALINDSSHSSTARFESDDPDDPDDPTIARLPGDRLDDTRGDPTVISGAAPGHAPAGTLRTMASLRRRPGITGDLRYVGTVVLGLRAARHELTELEARQATRQQSRRHHLITLGRTAVSQVESAAALAESIEPGRDRRGAQERADHPAVGGAREQLAVIEDERARHADHVAAADAELGKVRGERDAQARQHTIDLAAVDAELASASEKLAPLERSARKIRKRGVNHHESLRRIDARIAAAEASLLSVTGKKLDRSEVQAEIATLRADRKAIQSDEPAIAAELDALNPRIAGLHAACSEARRKRAELVNAEREDQHRVEDLLVAIGAQRKVVDRAVAAAEARRDKILFQLGERLCVDRPDGLTGQLAPLDEIDVELGVADRRIMELREIQSSVDKLKLARGIALLVVIVAGLGALGYWLFERFY
jgi:predicted  nucleic acid-binding Zn-ribbon protein